MTQLAWLSWCRILVACPAPSVGFSSSLGNTGNLRLDKAYCSLKPLHWLILQDTTKCSLSFFSPIIFVYHVIFIKCVKFLDSLLKRNNGSTSDRQNRDPFRVSLQSPYNLSSTLSADELDELWNRKDNRFSSTLGLGTATDPMIRCYYDI